MTTGATFQRKILLHMHCNKNVDIKISAHDVSLEYPSSGTLKVKIYESCITKKDFGSKKTKGPKQDIQSRLRSSMHDGRQP